MSTPSTSCSPFLSFYSRPFYLNAIQHWQGTGLLYLFLLLAICLLLTTLNIARLIDSFVSNEAPRYVEQFPKVDIVNGKLSIDKPSPYTITHPDTGFPLVIFNTSGDTKSAEATDAPIVVTASSAICKDSRAVTRSYDLSTVQNLHIDKTQITSLLNMLRWLGPIFIYVISLPFLFLGHLFQVLIYAALGILFSKALQTNLSYATLMRLSVVAMTPAILLSTFLELLNLPWLKLLHPGSPLWGLLTVIMTLGYLFFGLKALTSRQSSAEVV